MGLKGSCRECSGCDETQYLLQLCSPQQDSVCQACSALEAECRSRGDKESDGHNGTTVTTVLSGCGRGERGKCTVSVTEGQGQGTEPLWLIVIMIAAIAILTLTLCGIALHLRRWLAKRKSRTERDAVQGFEDKNLFDPEVGQLEEPKLPAESRVAGGTAAGVRLARPAKPQRQAQSPSRALPTSPPTPPGIAPVSPQDSASNELLLLQSRPVPLHTSGSAVKGRRPRPREPVLVPASDVIPASPPASPFDPQDGSTLAPKSWTNASEDSRSAHLEMSAGPPPLATLTPNGSKIVVDETVGSRGAPLSPAMTNALDEGAEKRKRLARDRGRRKAEARMKELADHSIDQEPGADQKSAEEVLGASEARSGGCRPGTLPPLRGARSVRSAMLHGGEQTAEEKETGEREEGEAASTAAAAGRWQLGS